MSAEADRSPSQWRRPPLRAVIERNHLERRRGLSDLDATTREQALRLAHTVFLAAGPSGPRAVVFAAVKPGEGCSYVCGRAAEALAALGAGSVCLVDGNLRNPSLHRHFRLHSDLGLLDAILPKQSVRDFVQPAGVAGLNVLCAGSSFPDPAGAVNSRILRMCVAELRSTFDYVIVDAPAAAHYADASFLGRLVDGVVLVVEADSTRRHTAQKAKQDLESAGAPVLGVVLNKRTYPIPESIYRVL